MDDFEERVRRRAYKIWMEEGCPDGRAQVHWDMARELVAIEDNLHSTLQPVPKGAGGNAPWGEPVEPASAAENSGDLPTLDDQGEQNYPPHRPNSGSAGGAPRSATRSAETRPQKIRSGAEESKRAAAIGRKRPSKTQ